MALGFLALQNSTGASNLALGSSAGANLTTGSNNIDIANQGVAGESATIRVGKPKTQSRTFIAGINGTSIGGPTQPVFVNSAGQLGTASAASAFRGGAAGGSVAAQLKRQRARNRREDREIANLKREVARLSEG